MKKIIKNKKVLYVLIPVLIVFISFGIEIIGYNYHSLIGDSWKRQIISVKNNDAITRSDSVTEENFQCITLKIPKKYVNKLQFDYKTEDTAPLKVIIKKKDGYGNYIEETIQDSVPSSMKKSVTNINGKLSEMKIILPRNVTIKNIQFNNKLTIRFMRIYYYILFIGLLAFILLSKRFIENRIEYMFAIIAVSIGILFINVLPTYGQGWDNHIHFSNAYEETQFRTVNWTKSAYMASKDLVPSGNTYDENKIINETLNSENTVFTTSGKDHSQVTPTSRFGYIGSIVFMKIAMQLNLSFTKMVVLGKLGNLLLYVLFVFFAIRYIPVGKRLLAAIGLIPTAMFQASYICYDPIVIGGMFLFFAVVIKEILSPEEQVDNKALIFAFVGIILASFAKAVYAPFTLIALLVPKHKFKDKKEQNNYYAIVIFVFIALMSTFILPTLMNKVQADTRGGATDVGGQLKLILSHPVMYTKILLSSIYDNLFNGLVSNNALLNFAYFGIDNGILSLYVPIFLITVALTDTKNTISDKKLTLIHKGVILVILFGVVSFIWTALYLSFSEVGSTIINGVSPRYFIPISAPILITLFMGIKSIECKMKDLYYNRIVFSSSVVILLLVFYQMIFVNIGF